MQEISTFLAIITTPPFRIRYLSFSVSIVCPIFVQVKEDSALPIYSLQASEVKSSVHVQNLPGTIVQKPVRHSPNSGRHVGSAPIRRCGTSPAAMRFFVGFFNGRYHVGPDDARPHSNTRIPFAANRWAKPPPTCSGRLWRCSIPPGSQKPCRKK